MTTIDRMLTSVLVPIACQSSLGEAYPSLRDQKQ